MHFTFTVFIELCESSLCFASRMMAHAFNSYKYNICQIQAKSIDECGFLNPLDYGSHVIGNRVFSTPVAWPVVTMETVGQTNPVRRDGMVWALSAHYIMLIRPQQALPLVRIY